jgi:hypothetical protein
LETEVFHFLKLFFLIELILLNPEIELQVNFNANKTLKDELKTHYVDLIFHVSVLKLTYICINN